MRLWHQSLIPYLDNKRLMGQHRECCALRGKGWKRKHATVDYVFKYGLSRLYAYHIEVMHELQRRLDKFGVDIHWYRRTYRGKNIPELATSLCDIGTYIYMPNSMIYPEHNDKYLKECLLNLKSKGAELVNGKTIDGMLIELDLKGV